MNFDIDSIVKANHLCNTQGIDTISAGVCIAFAMHLFEKGDYTWSLFIGHLVLEKLVKAWYIKNTPDLPPLIHDLVLINSKHPLYKNT